MPLTEQERKDALKVLGLDPVNPIDLGAIKQHFLSLDPNPVQCDALLSLCEPKDKGEACLKAIAIL